MQGRATLALEWGWGGERVETCPWCRKQAGHSGAIRACHPGPSGITPARYCPGPGCMQVADC